MSDKEYIAKALAECFKDEPWKAVYWLMTANPMLGGMSACGMIVLGRTDKLRQIMEAALDGDIA